MDSLHTPSRMYGLMWSLTSLVTLACLGLAVPWARAMEGAPAQATVSFGQWRTDPPLDRFPNNSPIAANNHELIPDRVTIAADGAITFPISGFHQPIIYDVDTKPEDIDASQTTPTTGTPAGVPLIDDPRQRIYRGLDPSLYPRDRGEGVYFEKSGTYLVICGVRDHFVNDKMYGFITVLPNDHGAE